MENLKQKAVRGGVARLFGQGLSLALRLLSTVVLARLLDPADFGLVAMITVITGFYGLFLSSGLNAALIQSESISEAQMSALFWISVALGAGLSALCLLTAPLIEVLYGDARLTGAAVALAPAFLLTAVGLQHSAILQRQLRYVSLTAIEITAQAASIACAIVLALLGWGYWALVVSLLVLPAVQSAGSWLAAPWMPGRPRRGAELGSLLHFSGTLTLNGIVAYVAYNFEKFLLGRYWGADALGIYGRAYQLINLPTEGINASLGGVAFASLSRLQNDPERIRAFFLKAYTLIVSMTLPIAIVCAMFAEDIVAVVFGPKWHEAAIVFRLLAPTIIVFGIINPLGWFLQATGHQTRSLRIALVIAPLVITAYIIGLPYGPAGVAFAYSAAMVAWVVPHIYWCLHRMPVSPRELMLAVSRPLVCGLVAVGVAFLVRDALFGGLSSAVARLLLGGGVTAAVYAVLLLFIAKQKQVYLDVFRALRAAT
jgi:PST family polysaccharide transporter